MTTPVIKVSASAYRVCKDCETFTGTFEADLAKDRKRGPGRGRHFQWRARFTLNGKRTGKRGFATEAEAPAAEVVTLAPTVGHLGHDWLLAKPKIKPSTLSVYRKALDNHVLPRWESTRVDEIRACEVQRWVTDMARMQSVTSVLRNHNMLSQILDRAVLDEVIPKNPAKARSKTGAGIELPRKEHASTATITEDGDRLERGYLNADQVRALARESGSKAAIVLVLAYVGIRWGELAGLHVGDVDLLRRRVHIGRNTTVVDGKAAVGTPKGWECRSIVFPKFLVPMFEAAI
ncbi:tyrosine-type recombinase/integrase [Lolliginicoccus suaedae]|uniref:tyrosine-type recombinase/integrase n=1 Tax=Lolliginicoccus suaedae TaxID=2605429 RepID=UPI0011ED1D62|nr:site-specific integrase [Lolliginicoccus suaedae]